METAEDDVGDFEQLGYLGDGDVLIPEFVTKVDVKGDLDPTRARGIDGRRAGVLERRGNRQRNAAEMKDPSIG